MSDKPAMPRIDDTVTPQNLHERAEQVAVPNFDWLNGPVLAVVDGLTHRRPPRPGHALEAHEQATVDEPF